LTLEFATIKIIGMESLMMNYPLTTLLFLNTETVFILIKNNHLPSRWNSTHEYHFDMHKRCKKLANALTKKIRNKSRRHRWEPCLESCASCGTVLRIAGIGAVCHPINIRLSGQQTEYHQQFKTELFL
jgi:fatty-acyl-CoA synthase